MLPVVAYASLAPVSGPSHVVEPLVKWTFTFIGTAMILFGAYNVAIGFAKDDGMSQGKALLIAAAGALLVLLAQYAGNVLNSSGGTGSIGTIPSGASVSADEDLVNWFGGWIPAVGYIVLFFGGVKLYMGFKDDNPGDKIKGMTMAVSGAAFSQLLRFLEFFLNS